MLNGLNNISSSALNDLLSSGSAGSLLGGATPFSSIFSQAMSQATTPAQKMEDAFLAVEYDNMTTLYDAVSGTDSTDSLLSSTNSLASDLGSVSAQVSQLEQQLGIVSTPTSSTQSATNMNSALALQAQMLVNNDLANFGSSSGSNINALL